MYEYIKCTDNFLPNIYNYNYDGTNQYIDWMMRRPNSVDIIRNGVCQTTFGQ